MSCHVMVLVGGAAARPPPTQAWSSRVLSFKSKVRHFLMQVAGWSTEQLWLGALKRAATLSQNSGQMSKKI